MPKPLQPGRSASTPGNSGREPSRSRAPKSRKATPRTKRVTDKPKNSWRPLAPRLRLTEAPPATVRHAPKPVPLQGEADPRWVLAVRTAELLQGDILSPERRERIVRMARMFDLTPFDANMIIAIVQDQARRGIAPHLCPAAGEPQLRMITPPRRTSIFESLRERYGMKVLLPVAMLMVIEVALIWWLL